MRLSHEESEFRSALCSWLDGVDPPEGLRDYGATPTSEDLGPAREWHKMLFEAGWVGLSWPKEHGGQEASPIRQALCAEELARRALPRHLSFVNMELAGPALIAHGSPEQQATHLASILHGDELWCQLFSEPGAGSDLAGLSTRATSCEEGWLVDGQKVWTSGAHYADYALLLARTDSQGPKHAGITCFRLPMDREGITVRPIRQIDGQSKFNEVFLDQVPVYPGDVVGDVSQGWNVALSILGRERRMLGSQAIGLERLLERLRVEAEDRGIEDDDEFRRTWSSIWGDVQLLRWTWLRLLSEDKTTADPRTSILKLTSSQLEQRAMHLAADVLGEDFVTETEWTQAFLGSFSATIAGGTSEIQRNILATRVLGMPRGDR